MPPHRSFLVTSLGAYDDSGFGTGGFTCVHEGAAVVLDKIDSTALFQTDDTIFRFARGLQSIVAYRPDGVRSVLRIPEAKDVHDVLLLDDQFVCVSTGTNEVLWFDAFGKITRRWKAAGEGDAWHLNCLCAYEGRLFVAAFGRFETHRGWVGKCAESGFVLDLESGAQVVSGLSGPHNPRCFEGTWVVCNSHAQSLIVQASVGSRREVPLRGFTRGLAADAGYFYVGESANRKADILSDHSFIAVLDRQTLEVVERIRIPFPEIYEVVCVAPETARRMAENPASFQIKPESERVRALEKQVELGLQEIERLRLSLDDVQTYSAAKLALTKMKRRLLG